jgi:hypothetical protein
MEAAKEVSMRRALIALLLCPLAALAQGTHTNISGNAPASAATYTCGGVGDADQKRIKSEAPGHDMMLTFATPSGAYLADIDVRVRRGSDVVLQAHCGGPLMLLDVGGKGSYQIEATSNGRTQSKAVTVGAKKPVDLSFVWPAS